MSPLPHCILRSVRSISARSSALWVVRPWTAIPSGQTLFGGVCGEPMPFKYLPL